MTYSARTFGLTLALSLIGAAHAENQALIMTISSYSDPSANLPGVAKDNQYALDIARTMGFTPNQITNLKNQQLTQAGMQKALTDFVRKLGPNDTAFIYYSGHGGQQRDDNGDEGDGCDEGLITYDMDLFTDDRINQILSSLKAKDTVMMVDSCFSGTISKSWINKTRNKSAKAWNFIRGNTLECNEATNTKSLDRSFGLRPESTAQATAQSSRKSTFMEFTATNDQQVALDGTTLGIPGSLFTYAVYQRLVKQGGQVTFDELRAYAAEYIREQAQEMLHTPQLLGTTQQAQRGVAGYARGSGSVTTAAPRAIDGVFDTFLARASGAIEFRTDRTTYSVDEPISLELQTMHDGYLNLVEIDPNGDVVLLFPNAQQQNNFVKANTPFSLPGDVMNGFEFYAMEPTGTSRVVAIVTPTKNSLFSSEYGTVVDGLLRFGQSKLGNLVNKATGIRQTNRGSLTDGYFSAGELTFEVIR